MCLRIKTDTGKCWKSIRSQLVALDANENNLIVKLFFIALLICYLMIYLRHPALPGNNIQHPLGWWGWFDQGQYILSAKSFAQFDFSAKNHHYPPMYSLIGALFYKLVPNHPFIMFNLGSFLFFAYTFLKVSRAYIGYAAALIAFTVTVVGNKLIFEQFVVPWTSTFAVAIISVLILILKHIETNYEIKPIKLWITGLFATIVSLIFPLRMIDSIVILPFCCLFLFYLYKSYPAKKDGNKLSYLFMHSLVGLSCFSAVIILYVLFNLKLSGHPLGNYFLINMGNGYHPADLLEKAYSIFLDGHTLYIEKGTGLLIRYPWMLLSLFGIAIALLSGPMLIRVIAISIVLQFAIYLPYGDFLPNSIFRFLNIHYFKWTFPYLGMFAIYYFIKLYKNRQRKTWFRFTIAASIISLLFVLSVRLNINSYNQNDSDFVLDIEKNAVVVNVNNNRSELDFIDIHGISGGFTELYFGQHTVHVDGQPLKWVKDYRFLPMTSGLRVMFIRPLSADRITIDFDEKIKLPTKHVLPVLCHYNFDFLMLQSWRKINSYKHAAFYKINKPINFGSDGNAQIYLREGWSNPEPWGRHSLGKKAKFALKLEKKPSTDLLLTANIAALINDVSPNLDVKVHINGVLSETWQFSYEPKKSIFNDYGVLIPMALIDNELLLQVEFLIDEPRSPKSIGINDDLREIGISVKQLVISDIP